MDDPERDRLIKLVNETVEQLGAQASPALPRNHLADRDEIPTMKMVGMTPLYGISRFQIALNGLVLAAGIFFQANAPSKQLRCRLRRPHAAHVAARDFARCLETLRQ